MGTDGGITVSKGRWSLRVSTIPLGGENGVQMTIAVQDWYHGVFFALLRLGIGSTDLCFALRKMCNFLCLVFILKKEAFFQGARCEFM